MDDIEKMLLGLALVIGGVIGYFIHFTPAPTYDYAIYQPTVKESDGIFIPPILLNKITGQTWRFYRDIKTDGSISEEGWVPFLYRFSDSKAFADTPGIAYRNYIHSFNDPERKNLKQYLSQESIFDDIRYWIYQQNHSPQ